MLRIIGGQFRNRSLRSPKGKETRPTTGRTREALFNICQAKIEGARVLDLYAGSGAIGIEALSRGAAEVVFVERARVVAQIIKSNLEALSCQESGLVATQESLNWLSSSYAQGVGPFDIIYADPPYGEPAELDDFEGWASEAVVKLVAEHGLLAPGAWLFVEEGKAYARDFAVEGLELVKARPMGKTVLSHYRRKESDT